MALRPQLLQPVVFGLPVFSASSDNPYPPPNPAIRQAAIAMYAARRGDEIIAK